MSETRIITCDQCGNKDRFKNGDVAIKDGWIEVWDGTLEDGESFDFCTKSCVVNYYSGTEEDRDE